jgi:hypothetical protein
MSSQRVSTRAQARAEGQQPEQPPALPAKADTRAKSASRKGKAAAVAADSNGGEPLESTVGAPQSDAAIALQAQVAALTQAMQQQQQELQALRASPQGSPRGSARPSPVGSPQQPQRSLGSAAAQSAAPAPAAGVAAVAQSSRFARKEPRAQDLREYDGASGAKLDDWLLELARAVRLFQLNDREAVDFAMARLSGAALQWSTTLNAAQLAALADSAALGAALRARFQPVTAARVAREQMRSLRQGSRSVNEYIADFQRLRAQLPDMSEADALFAFEAGASRDIAVELRKQRVLTVAEAISLAAHVGSVGGALQASSSSSHGRGAAAAAAQMEIDDGDGTPSLDERIQRAVLNAIQQGGAGGMHGLGAKTQTQRGYLGERRGGRGGFGARGGRGGGRGGFRGGASISIPGVPTEVVEQRRAAGQCFRCGDSNHRSMECPNAPSASPPSN